jgi:repressor LexA
MVIALVNNSAATVKKFYRERDGRIRLQPANETMSPIYVHESEVTIQGIVVGVMRKY